MHIPENYLSPVTCAILTGAMIPVWIHASKKVKEELSKEKIAMIGVGAAFSFIGMMLMYRSQEELLVMLLAEL